MWRDRLLSSTNESAHTFSNNSSLVMTSPPLSVRAQSSSISFKGRLTGSSSNHKTFFWTSSRNFPNSLNCLISRSIQPLEKDWRKIGEKVQDFYSGPRLHARPATIDRLRGFGGSRWL